MAQWAPGTGLGVAMLFWDCQCGHLLSGHVKKGISEGGIKVRCFQTLLCFSTSLPGERGVLRKIPKGWGCSSQVLERVERPLGTCLVSAQVSGCSGFIFQPGKALYGFQGCRWGVRPQALDVCAVSSSPTGNGSLSCYDGLPS